MNRPLSLLLAAVPLVTACGAGVPQPATSVERDSAGIRIVESAAPPDAPPAFRLSPEPLAQVGVLDGAPEYQLHRVQGATRLTDGTLVIANSGSRELRFYTADGTHLRSAGGEGAGPGEFRALTHLQRLAGDSLLVFDVVNRRISIIDATGRHVRDWSTAQGGRIMRVAAALPDGTLLAFNSVATAPERTVEYRRDTISYEIRRGDAPMRIPRRYASTESRLEVQESGGNTIAFGIMTLPFSRGVAAVTAGDTFVIGSNDTYELHVYDAAGSLRTLLRRTDVLPAPVTAELVQQRFDANRQQRLNRGETVADDEAAARRQALAFHRVESVPAYATVAGTTGGGLWIMDFSPPAATAAEATWSTYDSEARLVGGIRLPAGFRPLHIEDDIVVGVIQDEFDVEYVRVHRIQRSPTR